jgi:hypothetical protein
MFTCPPLTPHQNRPASTWRHVLKLSSRIDGRPILATFARVGHPRSSRPRHTVISNGADRLFLSPFASCEWVGWRRERSLFDRASSANCQTIAKERRAIYGTAVDAQAVLANAILRFQRLESREGAREAGVHALQSVEEKADYHPRDWPWSSSSITRHVSRDY